VTGPQPRFRAVVFDMDGVLTDSEPAFFAAVNDILRRYGASTNLDEYASFIGSATPAMWRSMIALKQLPVTLDEILEAYEVPLMQRLREPRPALPGARDLLAKLRERSVPIALCTASYRPWVDVVLPAAGIDIVFDAYATADVVRATKPDPEPYLLAASQLGVAPEQCIAVEDSVNGLTSALGAGMYVIQLRATRTSAPPQPGVAQVIESLDQFPLDLVAQES
jgi:beta-phosphoglucomutase